MERQAKLFSDEPHPPFVRDSDTSREAAKSIISSSGRLKQAIIAHMRIEGACTCDEIEVALSMRHQTASARIRELKADGTIRDTGDMRPTRSGRLASVYCLHGDNGVPF